MPRPKDDADRLFRNRQERRELLEGLSPYDDDLEELSEVTRPDIEITLNHPPETAPRPPQSSSGAISELSGTLDKLPQHHRLWALLALVLAALVAYLATHGKWSSEPVKQPTLSVPK